MKKLAIICAQGLDNFLDWVPKIKGYEVQVFTVRSEQEIDTAISWGDIIWFEWANEVAINGTNKIMRWPAKNVIVRLHSYEAFTGLPDKIHWGIVDKLITVAPHMKEAVYKLQPGIKTRISDEDIITINNGVTMDVAKLDPQHGTNIAVVADINHKKSPMMILQVLAALNKNNKDYTIHWAGTFQDSRFALYLDDMVVKMGLRDNIIFYGHINDMERFWKDKNYILASSPFESFGYGVFEAMARGIMPIVHNFPGAELLYPEKCLWNTIEQAVLMIKNNDIPYSGDRLRQWIRDNRFSIDDQVESIEKMLGEL